LPPVVTPPAVVDPPVGPGTNPETTPPDDTEIQTVTTIVALPGGGSTASTSQPDLVSEVRALTSLSGTQPSPDSQRSSNASTGSDDSIEADIWQHFLSSLNSSTNTTQDSGEEISVMLDRTDFGDMPDEQFFSLESGLQLSGVALSAGFVSWAIRGAGLFASLLTSLPAWRHMDPLPVLKEDGKGQKKRNASLDEDDDDHEIDEESAVKYLWTPGNGVQPARSDTGATLFVTSGMDAPNAAADLTSMFLEHVGHRTGSFESENPVQDVEELA